MGTYEYGPTGGEVQAVPAVSRSENTRAAIKRKRDLLQSKFLMSGSHGMQATRQPLSHRILPYFLRVVPTVVSCDGN
jgi:hypothetical protein